MTLEDLQPKPFAITVKGHEFECKPLRLSHAMIVSKIGTIFNDPASATKQQIKQAEADLDELIAELIPDLKDIQLDVSSITEAISGMMQGIQPTEQQELEEHNIEFDSEKKVERDG